MIEGSASLVRVALPSKGHLYDGSIALFRNAGYSIRRASERQYEATIAGHPDFHVVFMRPADIVAQVREGRCQLGITGGDVYAEACLDQQDARVILENLGYGGCRLTVAVPESWIDVTHILDLVDLTTEFKAAGKAFRVSTKYPHLVREAFRRWGIYHYQVIASDGALELHPSLGIADIIVDLTSSGATLKDNRLREIEQGTILESAACLIGNADALRRLLSRGDGVLDRLLDAIDAVRAAEGWLLLEAVGTAPAARAEEMAKDAVDALIQAGAEHPMHNVVAGVGVGGAEQVRHWRVTALVRSKGFVACRGSLAAMGALRIVGVPVALRFDQGAPSTADTLRASLKSE